MAFPEGRHLLLELALILMGLIHQGAPKNSRLEWNVLIIKMVRTREVVFYHWWKETLDDSESKENKTQVLHPSDAQLLLRDQVWSLSLPMRCHQRTINLNH